MLIDFICVEKCRSCGRFVPNSRAGPFCVCLQCWDEHSAAAPILETCSLGNVSVLVASGTTYSGVLKKMIYRLKYDKDKAVINDLVPLVCSAWSLLANSVALGDNVVVVPVPLHWMRLLTRGFNQAELMADDLCKKFKLTLDTRLLSRRRSTTAQHGLGKEQRQQNIAGAFRANRWAGTQAPTVVLLDDICTSGATLCEAAFILRKNGYRSIYAVTAARATLESDKEKPK